MASISDTLNQINSTLKESGGHYSNYSCKTVSWDDVQRGTVGGSLSCWGANITDSGDKEYLHKFKGCPINKVGHKRTTLQSFPKGWVDSAIGKKHRNN